MMNRKMGIVALMMIALMALFTAANAQDTAPAGSDQDGGRLAQILRQAVLRQASEATGLTMRELRAELRSGQSLTQVLTDNQVDINAFMDEAVNRLQRRLERAVERGRLTQESADELVAAFRDRLTEQLNPQSPRPA